jgi:hypothetical protein
MMLYFRSLKIVQHDIIVVLVVFLVSTFRHFLVGWFQYSYLNIVESPLRYVACFLNLSFDVLSVICRLHNLWSPFKIQFLLNSITVHEQAQSNRACNIFNFVVLDSFKGFCIPLFLYHSSKNRDNIEHIGRYQNCFRYYDLLNNPFKFQIKSYISNAVWYF